jgi:hypothetical protein
MTTRRRAEEFATAVDGARPLTDVSAEAQEFLAIVARLREAESPQMRPAFAADLRERLMTEAAVALAEIPAPAPAPGTRTETRPADDSWRARGLRIATASLLVTATVGGVAAASQSALPGDPLYQVKRGLEWVQVKTAGSDEARGDTLLNQASERLDEAERLAITHPDDPRTASLIGGALDDFSQQAQDGSTALVDDYEADGHASSIVQVREFADESATELDDLGRLVPPDAQAAVVDAAGVLSDIDAAARQTCEACSPLAPLGLSSALSQLAQETQTVLDVLPGVGLGADDPEGDTPPGQLPTLPDLTDNPGGGLPTGGGSPGHIAGGDPTTNGGHQPQQPPPSGGGSTTLPTLPLPSVPGIPLPTIPLPSLPLPSLPLTTLLPLLQ